MRINIIAMAKFIGFAFLSLSVFILPVKSSSLSEMVNQVLEGHEDIINAKKE